VPQKERIKKEETPKVIIPQNVVGDILTFCRRLPNDEWSAILFYQTVSGSIEDPNNLILKVKHIWPMAKGSGANVTTDYEDDGYIEAFEKLEDAENCKKGILHSHNTMGVFHSDTDMEDLNKNCAAYDYMLSIVTNNDLEFHGQIAISATEEEEIKRNSVIKFINSLGKTVQINRNGEDTNQKPVMILYDVEIESEDIVIEDKIFNDRIEEVINNASYTSTKRDYSTPHNHNNFTNRDLNKEVSTPNDFNDFLDEPFGKEAGKIMINSLLNTGLTSKKEIESLGSNTINILDKIFTRAEEKIISNKGLETFSRNFVEKVVKNIESDVNKSFPNQIPYYNKQYTKEIIDELIDDMTMLDKGDVKSSVLALLLEQIEY